MSKDFNYAKTGKIENKSEAVKAVDETETKNKSEAVKAADETEPKEEKVTSAENKPDLSAPVSESAPADDVVEYVTADDGDDEEVDNVVKLSVVRAYEGEPIREIDLRGIEKLNAVDLQKIDQLYRKNTKKPSVMPETTVEYALSVAEYLTELPNFFLRKMPASDVLKIKNRVVNFFYRD